MIYDSVLDPSTRQLLTGISLGFLALAAPAVIALLAHKLG